METGTKVTRVYSDFRGVDLRTEECALNRSPDALNVWRNYSQVTGIETRPALKLICSTTQYPVDMMWHGDTLYYCSSKGSYHTIEFNEDGSFDHTGDDLQYIGANSSMFEFGGSLYAFGKNEFLKLAGNGESEPFIPTTSVGALPDGTGRKTHQDVNMLTPYRINTFCGEDGESKFYLDAQDIDGDEPYIEINGENPFKDKPLTGTKKLETRNVYYHGDNENELTDAVIVNFIDGMIEIWVDGATPPTPSTKGADNVSIKFKKTTPDTETNKKKLFGCTIVEEFDNRIFLSGNPDYPNLVFHSSLNNPMYFSDTDVYEDGKDDGYIRAMVSGNSALWVFRDTDKGNGVYYHTASFDETYGKVYPSVHSNIPTGCVGGAVNFADDIVFFSRKGMESITQNITTEQFAVHKSSLIDRLMVAEEDYKDMVFAEWEGYLLVFIGKDVYLADSRAVLANENHYEYEWYHWSLSGDVNENYWYKVTCAAVHDGDLFIGVRNNDLDGYIYKFEVGGEKDNFAHGDKPIQSYWTTPKDKFAASNKLKSTNKKGFIIEATGELTVSSKVDNGEFDDGETFTEVNDHIVTKIKRKKFKDIQLKFKSDKKFTLESVTLEAFVGSFIKR